jgi:hypothetical protein
MVTSAHPGLRFEVPPCLLRVFCTQAGCFALSLRQMLRDDMIMRSYAVKLPTMELVVWTYEMPDGRLEQYPVSRGGLRTVQWRTLYNSDAALSKCVHKRRTSSVVSDPAANSMDFGIEGKRPSSGRSRVMIRSLSRKPVLLFRSPR